MAATLTGPNFNIVVIYIYIYIVDARVVRVGDDRLHVFKA